MKLPKSFSYFQFALNSPATGQRKIELYAPSLQAARKVVNEYDDETVFQKPISGPEAGFLDAQRPRSVKTKELLAFYEVLLRYHRAGASLSDGIVAAGAANRNKLMRGICGDVALEIGQGRPLSDVLEMYVSVFGRAEVASLKAAEATGQHALVIEQIVKNLKRKDAVIGKLKSAMMYPLIMLLASFGAMAFIQLKVYPVFRKQFEKFDFELPGITQFAMDISVWVEENIIVVAVVALVALGNLFLFSFWWRQPWFQKVILFFPVVGRAIRYTILTRALSTLGLLMDAGIKASEAYRIAGDASGAIMFKMYFDAIRKSISEGVDPDRAFMRNRGMIGPEGELIASQMRVSNVDGDSQGALRRVAEDFDKSAEQLAETLPELVKPVLIAVVFAIIGTAVISVLLPNFSMLVQVLQK